MGLQFIQKLEPQAASRWLYSHERLKVLHQKLVNFRAKGRGGSGLAIKIRVLMRDIAAEEESERAAIAAIAQVENRHRQNRQTQKLRRLSGACSDQNFAPERDEKPFANSWLSWLISLSQQPRLDLSNQNNS
jgi:hypothetical protein